MKTTDALVLVISRNTFYKRLHYLALAALALCILVILVLTYIVFYMSRNPQGPLYFATDPVSRLIPIIPVSKPNMSTEDVIAWTIEAIEATFSYDFINYRAQLQNAQKYFTTYGWTNYMKSIQATGNIVALNENKMVVIAKVDTTIPPKILAQGILARAYAWKFKLAVFVTYLKWPFDDKPGVTKFSNPLEITVIVQRQQILQSYRGLGIVQVIANIVTTEPKQPELTNPPPQ